MTGISWHDDTITVLRAPLVGDRYGDQIADWDNAAEIVLGGCRVVPGTGAENVVDRDQLTRRWLLFTPIDADLRATDRVRWDGDDYDIDGEVRTWRGATGALAHLEADLIRVEG